MELVKLITDQKALDQHLALLHSSPIIALDTEFNRQSLYRPELSLIQIGNNDIAFAIDMLLPLDFSGLKQLLNNSKTVKILHSARQDAEALYWRFGILIQSVFDTQIASQFCGFMEPPSYEKLVKHYLNVRINKVHQFSNWMTRPLTQPQIQYALEDVIFLYKSYNLLIENLKQKDYLNWVLMECNDTFNTLNFQSNPTSLVRKFWHLLRTEAQLAKCAQIVKWREAIAMAENKSRQLIISDDWISKIIHNSNLLDHPKLCAFLAEKHKQELKSLIIDSSYSKEEENIAKAIIACSRYKTIDKGPKFQALKELLLKTSEKLQIAPSMLATTDDLLYYIRTGHSRIMEGWRYKLFGRLIRSKL